MSVTASAEMLALAADVLACERARHANADDWREPMLAAFRHLQDAMSKLVGDAGFAGLLSRAIQLTRREHAWLDRVPLGSTLALEHLTEQARGVGEPATAEGAIALFAMVLQLFSVFIGSELTLRQVHHVWSELPTPTSAEVRK
jgi:hypothetical protein